MTVPDSLKVQTVTIQKGVSAETGVRRDKSLRATLGAAHTDRIIQYLRLIFAVAVGAAAGDLALCLQIVYDKHYNIKYLRVGQHALLVLVEHRKIAYSVLLHYIQQLKLGTRQLGLDAVDLADNTYIHVRIRARQDKQFLAVKQ